MGRATSARCKSHSGSSHARAHEHQIICILLCGVSSCAWNFQKEYTTITNTSTRPQKLSSRSTCCLTTVGLSSSMPPVESVISPPAVINKSSTIRLLASRAVLSVSRRHSDYGILTRRLQQLALRNVELDSLRRAEVNVILFFIAIIKYGAASPVYAHRLLALCGCLHADSGCPWCLHRRKDIGTKLRCR
jgi:hypothetical protein